MIPLTWKNIYLLIYSKAKTKVHLFLSHTTLHPHSNQHAKYAYHRHYDISKELSLPLNILKTIPLQTNTSPLNMRIIAIFVVVAVSIAHMCIYDMCTNKEWLKDEQTTKQTNELLRERVNK